MEREQRKTRHLSDSKWVVPANISMVYGDRNTLWCHSNCMVTGSQNTVTGDRCRIVGNHNTIKGTRDTIHGDHNTIDCTDSIINGDLNTGTAHHTTITGDLNIIDGDHNRSRGYRNVLRGNDYHSVELTEKGDVECTNTGSGVNRTTGPVVQINRGGVSTSITMPDGASGLGDLIRMATSIASQLQPQQKRRRMNESVTVPEDDKRDVAATDRESHCVICLHNKSRVVMVTCGHVCLCLGCAQSIRKNPLCPLCKAAVSQVIKIYT